MELAFQSHCVGLRMVTHTCFIVGLVHCCPGCNLVATSNHLATTDHELVYHGHDANVTQCNKRSAADTIRTTASTCATASTSDSATANTPSIGAHQPQVLIFRNIDFWILGILEFLERLSKFNLEASSLQFISYRLNSEV